MSKPHSRYADKFKYNASLQLDLLHRAIALYSENLKQKVKLSKYVDRVKELGLMQPRALKPFAKIIYKHLDKVIRPSNEGKYMMFTLVVGYDFGKNNWNMNYKKLQKKVRKLLKGYDYIATVALDEFPREQYLSEGTLMSWHVHGIFFEKPTAWNTRKINQQIERKGHKIIPLRTESYDRLIDAIYYAFKGPYGGKVRVEDKEGHTSFRHVRLGYTSYFQNLIQLKNYKIYDLMFAGGKGRKVLNHILEEINNAKA